MTEEVVVTEEVEPRTVEGRMRKKLTEARPVKPADVALEERAGKISLAVWVNDEKVEALHVRPFLIKSDVLNLVGADANDELYLLTRTNGGAWLTRIYGVSDGVVLDEDYCYTGSYLDGAK